MTSMIQISQEKVWVKFVLFRFFVWDGKEKENLFFKTKTAETESVSAYEQGCQTSFEIFFITTNSLNILSPSSKQHWLHPVSLLPRWSDFWYFWSFSRFFGHVVFYWFGLLYQLILEGRILGWYAEYLLKIVLLQFLLGNMQQDWSSRSCY